MAASTRATVSAEARPPLRLTMRETVATETPASRATVASEAAPCAAFAGFRQGLGRGLVPVGRHHPPPASLERLQPSGNSKAG